MPRHAQHGVDGAEARAAAVIRVAGGDESVVHPKLDAVAAQPAHQAPLLVHQPGGLGKHTCAGDRIGFVPLQGTQHAQVVDVATPPLGHALVLDACHTLDLALPYRPALVVLDAQAAETPVQVDRTAGRGGGCLGAQGNGQLVVQVARAVIGRDGDIARGVELVQRHHTHLVLRHHLAGVLVVSRFDGLARVGLELRAGQAQRVERQGLVKQVHDHSDLRLLGGIDAQLGVQLPALGGAVVAVAIRLEPGVVEHVVQLARLPARVEPDLAHAVRPHEHRCPHLGRGRTVSREHLHHARRRVAIHLSQWPAQHLDALGRRQADGRGLPLPVGHGGRNAVHDQARATDAERRARTRAAYGQLQVLRIVLPVQHRDAGDTVHGLRQVDLRPGGLQCVAPDCLDGSRRIKGLLGGAAGRHHHFSQRLGRCHAGGGRPGQGNGVSEAGRRRAVQSGQGVSPV